jgi:hypothetical protein
MPSRAANAMRSVDAPPGRLEQFGAEFGETGTKSHFGRYRILPGARAADTLARQDDAAWIWRTDMPGRAAYPVRRFVVLVRLEQLGAELGESGAELALSG